MTAVVPRTERAHVLGVGIDRLDMEQTVARCRAAIEEERYFQHVVVNAAKLVALHDYPGLREIVERCDIVNADGQAVVWAARLLGDPLPERVAGIDLMHELLALAAREGWGVRVLGARPEVLARALDRLRAAYTGLVVSGRDGYFGAAENDAVCQEIRASGARLLMVALPSPRKEEFLGVNGPSLGVPFVMGVGGAIDVAAGLTRRAPRLWQRLGLEWLWRLLQEPRRLGRRYVVTNARFIGLVAAERFGSTPGE